MSIFMLVSFTFFFIENLVFIKVSKQTGICKIVEISINLANCVHVLNLVKIER